MGRGILCFLIILLQLYCPGGIGIPIWIVRTKVEAMTLDEAVERALSDSDRIQKIRAERRRSKAEARQVDAFTKNQLHTSLSYQEMGTSAEDNPYFPMPDREASMGLSLSRLIWAGGRIPMSRALKATLTTLSELTEKTQTRNLIRELSMAFQTVLYEEARLDVMKDRVAQREDELGSAQDLFDAGMVTNLDVREAELNLHMAQDALQSGESDHHTALVDFNLLMGLEPGEGSALERPQGKLARAETLDALFDAIEMQFRNGNQLDLLTADMAVAVSEEEVGLARGARLPEIALVAGAEYGGETPSDYDASWRMGAQLDWHLFDGGAKQAAIDASLAERAGRGADRAKVVKDLAGAIDKLKREAESLSRRIALQEKSVELAHGNYRDAKALYGNGTMTMTRLGDFNLLYAEARFNLLRLHYLENLIAMEVESLVYE